LNRAALQAEQADILLTIEPLSPAFASDCFLTSSAQALDIVHAVDHPHVKFQFDTFHLQITEGNLIHTLRESMDAIGHIQFADAPGRTEPGQGELNFPNIAKAADAAGYRSYIGLEYVPAAQGVATFDWIPADWRRRTPPAPDSPGK
jgi:hydroxypyruvate isomerase